MSLPSERVIQEVRDELLRQETQGGSVDYDDAQPLASFLERIDQKLCPQATADLFEGGLAGARHRLIQIAALAVAAAESLDRRIQQLGSDGS